MASYFKFNENFSDLKKDFKFKKKLKEILVKELEPDFNLSDYRIEVQDVVKRFDNLYCTVLLISKKSKTKRYLLFLENNKIKNLFSTDFLEFEVFSSIKIEEIIYSVTNSKVVFGQNGNKLLIMYNPSLQNKRIGSKGFGPFILVYDLDINKFIYKKDAGEISIIEKDNFLYLVNFFKKKEFSIYLYYNSNIYLLAVNVDIYKVEIDLVNKDNLEIKNFNFYMLKDPLSTISYYREANDLKFLESKKVLISELVEGEGFIINSLEYKLESDKIVIRDIYNKEEIDISKCSICSLKDLFLKEVLELENVLNQEVFVDRLKNILSRVDIKVEIENGQFYFKVGLDKLKLTSECILNIFEDYKKYVFIYNKNKKSKEFYFFDEENLKKKSSLLYEKASSIIDLYSSNFIEYDSKNNLVVLAEKDRKIKLSAAEIKEIFKNKKILANNAADIFIIYRDELIWPYYRKEKKEYILDISAGLEKIKQKAKYLVKIIEDSIKNINLEHFIFSQSNLICDLFYRSGLEFDKKYFILDNEEKVINLFERFRSLLASSDFFTIFYNIDSDFLLLFEKNISALDSSDIFKEFKNSIFMVKFSNVKKFFSDNIKIDRNFFTKDLLFNIFRIMSLDPLEAKDTIKELERAFSLSLLGSFRKKPKFFLDRKKIL